MRPVGTYKRLVNQAPMSVINSAHSSQHDISKLGSQLCPFRRRPIRLGSLKSPPASPTDSHDVGSGHCLVTSCPLITEFLSSDFLGISRAPRRLHSEPSHFCSLHVGRFCAHCQVLVPLSAFGLLRKVFLLKVISLATTSLTTFSRNAALSLSNTCTRAV